MNKERHLPPQQHEALQAIDSTKAVYDAIASRGDTEKITINPGIKMGYSLDHRYEGAATYKPGVGDQELMAFVRSKDRLFSVVAFQPEESQEMSYSLNEVGLPDAPDETQRRARLAGMITKNGLTFAGADSLDEPDIEISIDNSHGLLVGPVGDQDIQILHPKATQEVNKHAAPSGAKIASGGLRRFIKKRQSEQIPQIDLNDFTMWAPKTREVAGTVQEAAAARVSKPRIPSFSRTGTDNKPPEKSPMPQIDDHEPRLTKEVMQDVQRRRDEERKIEREAAKQKIEESIEELMSGLSEKDAKLMHTYSHYMSEKREMWRRQDDNGAMNADEYATEALRGMTPQAKDAAHKYHQLKESLYS